MINAVIAHRKLIRLRRILFVPVLLALFFLPFLSLGQAHAVSKTWDGGCGADTTWSCANNWSDNIVPASGDTVTFNATSTNNSVVDASFAGTITTININSGYTGTISLSRSLTVSTTFSQAAGTFNAGSQTLTLAAFTLSAGTFTASSGTTNVSGAITISGSPTFNANGGTVNINGTTTATLSCNSVTFNLVTFTSTSGTKTINSNCTLPMGNNPSAITAGTINLNGTISGTGTLTAAGLGGVLNLKAGSALSGFSGLAASTLTIQGTYNLGSYTTFTAVGSFAIDPTASVTMPSGTASFAGNFTIDSAATFNANGGTVNFNVGGGTLACGNKTFSLVTFTHTAGTKTVSSNCSFPLGANPTIGSGTAALTLSGTLSGTGTLTTIGTLNLGVGGSLSGFSGLSTGTLIVNGTYNFGSYSTFTTIGTFTLGATSNFTAPAGTASFASTFTINSGAVFNANGGTINFNRTVTTTVVLTCSNATFNLVTFTNTAGATESVSSDCSFPLGNNPTVSSGGSVTLNGTLSGSGTMTKSGGLTLNAGSVMSGFSGFVSNSNLTINGSYNFGSYSPFTVAGIFTLNSGAVFTAPSGTASFGSTFTINSGATFNANGGTVNFNSSISQAITCNNAVFNLVTIVSTGTTTVGSTCNLPLGNDPYVQSDGGTIVLNGTLSGTGTLHHAVGTSTGGQLNIRDGYVLSGFTGLITGRALNSSVTGTADLSNLTTLILGINYLTDPSSAGGLLVQSGGTFIAPSAMSVYGNFDIVSGSNFNANGGTVNLIGGDQLIIGDITFYNLTKTVTSATTLTFTAGNTVTVAGALTLKGGDASNLLSLASDIPGSSWFIDPQGSRDIRYVSVSDSTNTNSTVILAYDSFDGGNNIGWSFEAPTVPGTPTTSSLPTDTTPTFSWTASTDGGQPVDHYEVQWSQDPTFTTGVITDSSVTGTSCTLSTTGCGGPDGLALGTWYVRVRAFNTLGSASAYSGTGSTKITPTGGSGATTAITNFESFQAAQLKQSVQNSRNQAAAAEAALPGSNSLPAKISSFLNQFPAGKGLAKAAGQFLIALVVLFILGLLVGLWLIWWHRRKQAEEEAEEYDEKPPVVKPPSWPPRGGIGTDYYNAQHGKGGQL